MSALRLVQSDPPPLPLSVQLADCALSLADIWVRERDRAMKKSAENIVDQAHAEFAKTREPLLHGCALICGCVSRAIETEGHISDLWTDAVRAVAISLHADAMKRAAN